MRRILSFLNETAGTELVLPVTPPSYQWSFGRQIESVMLDQLGEINLPGGTLLGSCTLEVLLPARLYPFCNAGASPRPDDYLDLLETWSKAGSVLRWIVSGTRVNTQVLIESVEHGEEDGTNDIYATIRLRGYQRPEMPVLAAAGGGVQTSRDSKTGASSTKTYTVQPGDTLWGIARKYYGSGPEYKRIAAANQDQIKNPNLIYPGQTITIPAADDLPGAGGDSARVAIASETRSSWDPVTGTWNLTL